jgi:hypothetical protein
VKGERKYIDLGASAYGFPFRVACSPAVFDRCISLTAAATLAGCTLESRTRDVLDAFGNAFAAATETCFRFDLSVVSRHSRLDHVELIAVPGPGHDGEARMTIKLRLEIPQA